jgi:hypothetical protein
MGSIPARDKWLFSSPPRPDKPWEPYSLLPIEYWDKAVGLDADHSSVSSAEAKNVELYLHSSLRLNNAVFN